MERKIILKKIKSKYIYQHIIEYIKDKNYKYNLFVHSKFFQKQLDLNLYSYQERYISHLKMNIYNYLLSNAAFNGYQKNFNKNLLIRNLQEDLLKYGVELNIYEKYVENYFKKEDITDFDIKIDIFSPFFKILLKTEFFGRLFRILISTTLIEKYNLKNEYIFVFDELNKSNMKYTSLTFYFKNSNDLDYFNEFKIKLKQIKNLDIIEGKKIYFNYYNSFFTNFFSFKDIYNNLLYLNLHINSIDYELIDNNIFENLYNFTSLIKLSLNGFKFKSAFKLKLYTLKELNIQKCSNLSFPEDNSLNLTKLIIDDCSIIKPISLIIFPYLEDLELENITYNNQAFNSIIDFSQLKLLKRLKSEAYDFIYLENDVLENLSLKLNVNSCIELERKMFEKILLLQSLQYISFEINKIDDYELSKFDGENNSINKMEIKWENEKSSLYNFLNKFPNLTHLIVKLPNFRNYRTKIDIRESPKSKINKFCIKGGGIRNIKFYCHSYQTLVDVEFNIICEIIDIKDVFPIFSDNCILFKSLVNFKLNNECDKGIGLNILKNIYNNIDCMPNLKKFSIKCISKDLNEEFYIKFINKILDMKLDYVNISIKKDKNNIEDEEYSEKELKEIYPKIKSLDLKNIIIKKYK